MSDDSKTLHAGERNRVWFQLGATDPTGPYEVQLVNASTDAATAWVAATAGTYPGTTDGRGIYVWARNGAAPGEDPTGVLTPARGLYVTRIRHLDGYLVDIAELDLLEVE